jgi:hypothetical protein
MYGSSGACFASVETEFKSLWKGKGGMEGGKKKEGGLLSRSGSPLLSKVLWLCELIQACKFRAKTWSWGCS